jgi:hypothetical protein
MSQVDHLRERASLYRQIANVPTEGGHHEDRILLDVANQLERKAEELEETRNRLH